MMPPMDDAPASLPASAAAHTGPARLPLHRWLLEGLRSGFFLRPRIAGEQPTAGQVTVLLLIASLVEIALARLEVAGAAQFDLRGWLAPWWSTAALVLLAWWALPPRGPAGDDTRPAGLAAWFALWLSAVLPANAASQLLGIAQAHEVLPQVLETSIWAAWLVYLLLWGWIVGAVLRLSAHFGVAPLRLGVLAVGMMSLFGLAAVQSPDRPWQAEASTQRPRLVLSQDLFEAQQALWQKTIDGIAPDKPAVVDLYALVFSPYAAEDVFLRESSMVAGVLAERFDAAERVIHLANHPAAAQSHPWATRLNLERGIETLAARMDREHDVLVVYLTSHGAGDFKLAAANEPLNVEPVGPGDVRRALDRAGVRHRVIVVSACYSGGWVGPLASDTTLVMTAAAADRTSYGCGRLSQLTYFGRAVFDEQLRKTRSFEEAFAAAVPLIRQREIDAGKDDGFSDPQISVGEQIRPVLRELERRLEVGQ